MAEATKDPTTFSVRLFLEHGALHLRTGLTLEEATRFARELAASGPGSVGIMDDSTNETVEELEWAKSSNG